MKKESKEVKIEVNPKVNPADKFYLIYKLLLEGKNPAKISRELNISKQSVNFYIQRLKHHRIAQKVGYGTWETKDLPEVEVKKIFKQTTGIAKKPIGNFSKYITHRRLKDFLIQEGRYKCLFCSHKNIHFHHIIPRKEGGMNYSNNLIPVCPNHHQIIHSSKTSRKMNTIIKEYLDWIISYELENKVRGHAFMFKISLPKNMRNWDKRSRYLDKANIPYKPLNLFGNAQSLLLNNNRVWLTNKSIIFFLKESFIAETAKESKSLALWKLVQYVKSLEKLLKANFTQSGKYLFKVSRQHYSLMKNSLAKQYDAEGRKLNCYTSDGLWLIVDNSFNLHELETVHPKTALPDNKTIQEFMNDLKENPTTLSKIEERYMRDMSLLSQNVQSHLLLVKESKTLFKKMSELIEKFTEKS